VIVIVIVIVIGRCAPGLVSALRADAGSRPHHHLFGHAGSAAESGSARERHVPHGAWDYHSELELIKNDTMMREKSLRIFLNVNEDDLGSTAAESGQHNWVMADDRTAEDLAPSSSKL
jgi:hypothetical protein